MTEAEVRSMCILALKMKAKEHGQSLEPERVKEQILPKSVQKESSFKLSEGQNSNKFVLFTSLSLW